MSQDLKPLALQTQPLMGSDLHVWTVALNSFPEKLQYFDSLLAADEKARAARFYFERDRNRYIVGRGILRSLLASYLGMHPADMRFVYGPQRKPELVSDSGKNTLQFNLAHSNDRAAYIFGWDRPLGIDLEFIRPMPDVDALVQRFFSARETYLIHSLAGPAKWEMFFKIWTCKEAILKAYGAGLTIPLNRFEISLDAKNAVTLRSAVDDEAELAAWHLQIMELVNGYSSAIAVNGEIGRIMVHGL